MLIDPSKGVKNGPCLKCADGTAYGLKLKGSCLVVDLNQPADDFKICLNSLFIPFNNSYFRRVILAPDEKKLIKADFFGSFPTLLMAYVEEKVPSTSTTPSKYCGSDKPSTTAKELLYRIIDPIADEANTANLTADFTIEITGFMQSIVSSISTVLMEADLDDMIFDWANSRNVLINGINPQFWRDFGTTTWRDLAPQNLTTSLNIIGFSPSEATASFYPISTTEMEGVIKFTIYDLSKTFGVYMEMKVTFDVISHEVSIGYNKIEFLGGYSGDILTLMTQPVATVNGDDVTIETTGEYRSTNIKKYNTLQSFMMLSGSGIYDMELWNKNDTPVAIQLLYAINE